MPLFFRIWKKSLRGKFITLFNFTLVDKQRMLSIFLIKQIDLDMPNNVINAAFYSLISVRTSAKYIPCCIGFSRHYMFRKHIFNILSIELFYVYSVNNHIVMVKSNALCTTWCRFFNVHNQNLYFLSVVTSTKNLSDVSIVESTIQATFGKFYF